MVDGKFDFSNPGPWRTTTTYFWSVYIGNNTFQTFNKKPGWLYRLWLKIRRRELVRLVIHGDT